MHIRVIPNASQALHSRLGQDTVIIIDVLRATSTMLAALTNGAIAIAPVDCVKQAKAMQAPHTVLGGERHCQLIAGFDLGNSPLEYTREAVGGRLVVMTTTNGTRAIEATKHGRQQLIGSLLNASACAAKAAELGRNISLVCAGTRGQFALEDALAAGLIIDELLRIGERQQTEISVDDLGLCVRDAAQQGKSAMIDTLLACESGKRLTQLGFEKDVRFCAQIDLCQIAPIVLGGTVLNETPSHTMG